MLTLSHDQLVVLSLWILAAPLLALLLDGAAWIFRRPLATHRALFSMGWITPVLSAVSLLCSLVVAMGPADEYPLIFNIGVDFYLDALSVYFVLLVNLVAFFASLYTVDFFKHDSTDGQYHDPWAFHLLFNAFHLTMLIVPMVDNLVILWMAIELTTLASTLLVRYRRRRETLEAAWKYIIITTAGIVFALFGTILFSNVITSETCVQMGEALDKEIADCSDVSGTDLMRWSLLGREAVARTLDSRLVILAFLFVLIGYGTKAGLAPMHTWLPDGHGEAPSPVSALLSGVLLKSALFAILRFYTITNLNQGNTAFTSTILLASGLLSLVLAVPLILKRNKFKRILAYHSLEHMGIIVFGVGVGGPVALFGALLHALNHALTKALMFLTFGHVRREYAQHIGDSEPVESEITGVLTTMPVSGYTLLFGGLGLVGSPPFNIFLSEFIILWAAFGRIVQPEQGQAQLSDGIYVVAVGLFLLSIILIFGGLVAHLAHLLLGQPTTKLKTVNDPWRSVLPLLPLLLLLAIVFIFGIWIPTKPIDLPRLLEGSVCVLQNGAGEACYR